MQANLRSQLADARGGRCRYRDGFDLLKALVERPGRCFERAPHAHAQARVEPFDRSVDILIGVCGASWRRMPIGDAIRTIRAPGTFVPPVSRRYKS
jgi:hypothetical protein